MKTDQLKQKVFKEGAIFLAVLLVGYIFSAEGPTNFRYPMSPRPEVKVGLVAFGKLIMYGGYPILLLLRFLLRRRNEQRKG